MRHGTAVASIKTYARRACRGRLGNYLNRPASQHCVMEQTSYYGAPGREVRFAADSPVEEDGFELSVSRNSRRYRGCPFRLWAFPVAPERPARFASAIGGANPSASESDVRIARQWPRGTRRGRCERSESGWGVPHWPSRWYGRDLPVGVVPVVEEEFKRIGAIGVAKVGIRTLATATILAHGTDLQKEKFLLRILTGEDIWCQLFSEPSSGSDVAGAVTRAEFRGNQWVVNGQKVWTTSAHKGPLATLNSHSWSRQRIVGLTRKRSFAPAMLTNHRLKPTRRAAPLLP
jgi:Acyl-CoA dehydrogenase, middle domain/Acyl-CoA dehydrogenase, N-terminal domain